MTPEIAVGVARRTLTDFVRSTKDNKDEFKINVILDVVCHDFCVSVEDLRSDSRKAIFRHPRHVAIHLLRHHTKLTLKDLGGLFNRHHTTVMSALESINHMYDFDIKFRKKYRQLERLI